MVENAKKLKVIRIIGSVVFALLLVLFVLCSIFAKMQMDNSFGLFGTTFAVKKSIDECNLPNGSLVLIKPTAANTFSVVAYVDSSNQIRLTEKAYLPSNAKLIGGAIGYAPILGGFCSYVYQNTFAFGAFAVLLVALLVFLLTYRRGGNRVKIQTRRRISFQTLWFIITNSFIIGYIKGSIYQGKIKQICVPGLNCYSCPGALGACPIGSMQAVLTQRRIDTETGKLVSTNYFPFYAVGAIMIFGALMGRLICGFLCPFGWAEELLYRVPTGRLKIKTFKGDKALRYLKYAVLVVFVIAMPLFIPKAFPWFCKLICPSGMLFGGIPLMSVNEGLRNAAGAFTVLKLAILAAIIISSVIIYRPFCKYLCPLGAMYALLNKVSLYRGSVNESACIHCNKCVSACEMGVNVLKTPNALECIRCGDCKAACPTGAINFSINPAKNKGRKVPKITYTKTSPHSDVDK